jgi:proteasome-associated ATPase
MTILSFLIHLDFTLLVEVINMGKKLEEMSREDLENALLHAEDAVRQREAYIERMENEPPKVVGTIIDHDGARAIVAADDHRTYEVNVGESVTEDLEPGEPAYLHPTTLAVLGPAEYDRGTGSLSKVTKLLDDGRIVIERGGKEVVIGAAVENIKPGNIVRLDPSETMALEVAGSQGADLYLERVPNITWDQIGGLEEAKRELREAIELRFTRPDLVKKYKQKPPKGVLLHGPPGCGKSLLAKAVAKYVSERTGKISSYINVKGPELLDPYVGVAEANIRMLFERAREEVHEDGIAIISVDEADALFKARGTGRSSDVNDTVVAQFLAELDGVEEIDNVMVILATNRMHALDTGILRPGRMDRRIKIGRPNQEAAEQIYRIHLDGLPFAEDIEYAKGAALTIFDYSQPLLKIKYLTAGDENVFLYLRDLVSGALIEGSVARAKNYALRREMEGSKKSKGGITRDDIASGIQAELDESADALFGYTHDDLTRVAKGRTNHIYSVESCWGS